MNYGTLERQAVALAAQAKDGTLKLHGHQYKLTFTSEWIYRVTDEHGEEVTRFNTKSLQKARSWLREWFQN
jgi:hypothetical protein